MAATRLDTEALYRKLAPLVPCAALCLPACGDRIGSTRSTASGSLAVSGCVIAERAASCQGSVRWTTTGAAAPRVVVGGVTVSTAPSGAVSATVGVIAQAVTLFDGEAVLDQGSIRGVCVSASAWDGSQCRPFALRLAERVPTPFVEAGRPVSLELIVFKPLGAGPFPAVVFHHGSTGTGSDPSLFTATYTNEAVAQFFAERGFLVAFPQRRGRGTSDGLYDEGFTPDRSGYSCLEGPALAGFQRALQDVEVAVDSVRRREDVSASRLFSAGMSRGGALAVAHAGLRSRLFLGVVNFVGGWLGEGCSDAVPVNRATLLQGAAFDRPTLWLYGANDSFYSLPHTRANFDAFVAAGGRGAFLTYTRAPTLNGHFIINDPVLWTSDLDGYVRQIRPD